MFFFERFKNNADKGKLVDPLVITVTGVFLVILTLSIFYVLAKCWSHITSEATPLRNDLFGWAISNEADLLITVAMAGALGGIVHSLRSFSWYVGNRDLRYSWLAMIIFLPFMGMTLASVFYFVTGGGFGEHSVATNTNWLQASPKSPPYAFVALASIVGLFSEQAILKLKDVSETMLTKAEKGKDRQDK